MACLFKAVNADPRLRPDDNPRLLIGTLTAAMVKALPLSSSVAGSSKADEEIIKRAAAEGTSRRLLMRHLVDDHIA